MPVPCEAMLERPRSSENRRLIESDRLVAVACFVAVATSGSFSAAALTLDASPSTVSRRVARLETLLGMRLIERTTRHIALTEAGRIYLGFCGDIFDRIAEADATIAAYETGPRGKLRISAPLTFGRLYIGTGIAEFVARHPEVSVELDLTDRYVDLIDENYDAAIRIGNLSDSSLIIRKLADNRQRLVAAPDYVARHGAPREPSDIEHHHAIVFSRRMAASGCWQFFRGDEQAKAKVKAALRSDNSDVVCRAVLDGMGVGLIASYIAHPHIEAGTLVPIMEDWQSSPGISIHVAYPSRRHLSPKVRSFADFLAGKFRNAPWL